MTIHTLPAEIPRRIDLAGVCFFLLAAVFAQPLQAQSDTTYFEVSVTKFLMGTVVETTARHPEITACKQALFFAYREMERVENLLSSHKQGSEIAAVNRAAGRRPVKVSAETFAILQRAKDYAHKSNGLFDVSIGPLSELWGFNGNAEITLPDSSRIAALRKLVNYRDIVLSAPDTTVYLRRPGMKIDLGGIAKGYAIDRGAAVLRQHGVQHFILNAGGDMYVSGEKAAGQAWRIGIKHPRRLSELVASFPARNSAVATSGDYERYKIINGRRYHHILDPRTGYPSPRCQSVTMLAPTAEQADVLATALFIRGYQAAARVVPQQRPYLIVAADGSLHSSAAFARLPGLKLMGAIGKKKDASE